MWILLARLLLVEQFPFLFDFGPAEVVLGMVSGVVDPDPPFSPSDDSKNGLLGLIVQFELDMFGSLSSLRG